MKYFIFDKCIDDLFNDFLKFINDNVNDDKTIILDTNGGKCGYANIISKIINNNPCFYNLIANKILSSGFAIFYKAVCTKYLSKDAIGAYHMARFNNIDILNNGKQVWDFDIAQLESKNVTNDNLPTDFMNKSELKKYKKGDDVFFNYERLQQIFPQAEII